MNKWFGRLPVAARLAWTLIVFLGGIYLVGGSFGLAMGDPLTPEAHEFQEKWAPAAFFLGCLPGWVLIGLSLGMLIGCFRKPTDPPV